MLPLIIKYPKASAAIAVVAVVAAVLAARAAKNAALGLGSDVASAINPLNPGNVFNETFNQVTRDITGDDQFSFGAWIYEITHPGRITNGDVTPYPNNPARSATRSESAGPMPQLSDLVIP